MSAVIVNAAKENAVDLQARSLDLVGDIASLLSPFPMQHNAHFLVFSDEQGSVSSYWQHSAYLFSPYILIQIVYKKWNEHMLISGYALQVSLSLNKCLE